MVSVPEGPGELGLKLAAQMDRLTWDKVGPMGLANAERNRALLTRGELIAKLRGAPLGKDDSAIVIAAGPSIARRDPLKEIKQAGYRGAIIATDSAMYYCLRNGVVPDLVVTVDPHCSVSCAGSASPISTTRNWRATTTSGARTWTPTLPTRCASTARSWTCSTATARR